MKRNQTYFTSIITSLFILFLNINAIAQSIPTPTIIEVKEDDRAATIYWNSKTNTYAVNWDPDKQIGIYSYLIEWGKVSEGFTEREVTPYRVFMAQPLEPGEVYQAKVYALDSYGNKSNPSSVIQFQHSSSKVDAMRSRLTGFFDDFNLPMGPFDETKWNQAYSGCMKVGYTSQHINNQYHAHNVLASGGCDRAVASSRVRQHFDFTDRTGIIEFDLDGSKLGRQLWYLDITPANRKRDLTGHTALEDGSNPPQGDPAHLLRISEENNKIKVQLGDENGNLTSVSDIYRNGACGNALEWCPIENLDAIPNVRRHWKIELSKTSIKIFINDILVIDGDLQTPFSPAGLMQEIVQVNWLFFSYNTTKENLPLAMLHWDNFGFDGPSANTVIHNYTDGKLGTDVPNQGNEQSAGSVALLDDPAIAIIPIPDSIRDQMNNDPITTELMFTIQGGSYEWMPEEKIVVNGIEYTFPKPTSTINNFPEDQLINAIRPYSVLFPIQPNDLIVGNNQIEFYLNDARILNVHIELKYPQNQAPSFTSPINIFPNYMQSLMAIKQHTKFGPNIIFEKLNGTELWQTSEYERVSDPSGGVAKLVKQSPVDGELIMDIVANMDAQLAATGHAYGITHIDILIDSKVVKTIAIDGGEAVAGFRDTLLLNTFCLGNGTHELFVMAYDTNGYESAFDLFLAHVHHGEYVPIEFTVINAMNNAGNFFVNELANGTTDGLSWSNAFTNLQAAVDACSTCDGLGKVWLAQGTYLPPNLSERSSRFDISIPVQIYGGFQGNEQELAERDIISFPSILSGDFGILNDSSDNVYHVMEISNQEGEVLLDGLEIRNGNANGSLIVDQSGAGILVNGAAQIINCKVEDVISLGLGNAIYINESKALKIENSIIQSSIQNNGVLHIDGEVQIKQ